MQMTPATMKQIARTAHSLIPKPEISLSISRMAELMKLMMYPEKTGGTSGHNQPYVTPTGIHVGSRTDEFAKNT